MTEAQHQTQVFKWALQPAVRRAYPELKLLHHIPNGGKRDPIEAKHLKEQGVKSGVPDLHLPVARGGYHGLYIEMKTETGRASQNQKWWLEQLAN
ncbi:MAG: VRR-NUC domain-containing protein, partial [Lachnospiraceae bacterium]|nr:VRR-NUC domain-containing protein [Lachnospiraceae bacterium]